MHRSFLLVQLFCCVFQWIPSGHGWIQGALGSSQHHSVHPPGYWPALLGFQEVLQVTCSRFQGRCKVKHPVLSSSSRMEQCKELLPFFCYPFLPSDSVVLPFTSSSITGTLLLCSCPVLQLLTAPVQTLLLHPSMPSSFPSTWRKSACFLDQTAA